MVDPYHMTKLPNAIHDDIKQQGHRYEEEVVGEVHVEGAGGGFEVLGGCLEGTG